MALDSLRCLGILHTQLNVALKLPRVQWHSAILEKSSHNVSPWKFWSLLGILWTRLIRHRGTVQSGEAIS